MRFRNQTQSGDLVAVTGVNTVSFAMLVTDAVKKDLLGFAVERIDPAEDERYFMAGFKVFESLMPNPPNDVLVSTFDHPVQSFSWDDFTAKPGREYTYNFYPLKGKPKKLNRSAPPLTLTVQTEPLFTRSEHDVFFNRGVASSQAYRRNFGATPINKLKPERRAAALGWLSRDLDEALLRFINNTKPGDRLLGCFYEFRYPPATDALVAAIGRGVEVHLIIDMKENTAQAPLRGNQEELKRAKLPAANWTARKSRRNDISHNKFMVRIRDGKATEVWTGSTNLTPGGVAGQTNVGHWLRKRAVAEKYVEYWNLLKTDPGGTDADSLQVKKAKNAAFETAVEEISPVPDDLRSLPNGTTPIFSPRPKPAVLTSYVELLDAAAGQGCVTLAFGIGDEFKRLLSDNSAHDALIFALLEKRDKPNPRSTKPFVVINAANNVYKAWGSYLRDPVYQWARETNTRTLGLNHRVFYVHSKFMLVDPLGEDPIVVTGSANFSPASTVDNDENMLVIRGNFRAADIYLTEFNRLFNHYYFRSVTEQRSQHDRNDPDSLFLEEDDSWQEKYAPGKLKRKRLDLFAQIHIP